MKYDDECDDFTIDAKTVTYELYLTLKENGGEKSFYLNDNVLNCLLENDDNIKFQVLALLIHNINYDPLINSELKSDLISSITVGLNVIFNKKLTDKI